MATFELPEVVNRINKEMKAIKITTLSRANAFKLMRFFSGSFGVDFITGGGFAHRRIQLLFGARSSGKNALLNQMTAYLQRTCVTCHGVLPDYMTNSVALDRWAFVLLAIMGIGKCNCDAPIPKKVLFLDYERALAIEQARDVKLRKITDATTGEDIDELDYNDAILFLHEMKTTSEGITPEKREKIKESEALLKRVKAEEKVIKQLSTKDYLLKCGVNPDQLLVSDPESTEEGIEIVKSVIKSKEVSAIIWDSLQAAIPQYVMNRDSDQATMGVEAKQNGLLMRQVCSSFAAADLTDESEAYKPPLIITSQVRASLGGLHSGPDTYSGGNAVQHHISLALEVKREKWLKADGTDAAFADDFYGQTTRLRADKNKLNAPGDMYSYDYFFRESEHFPIGIDSVGELINLGVKLGVIQRAGAYYKLKTGESIQGQYKLKEHYRTVPEAVRELFMEVMSYL